MKKHFCPAEQSTIAFEKECNWCGEKEVLAQEQEPVAWEQFYPDIGKPQLEMKVEGPLHVVCQCDKCKPQISFNAEVIGYVEPQRTWVGLTDEERQEIWWSCEQQTPTTFVKAIEAKLKEKNT